MIKNKFSPIIQKEFFFIIILINLLFDAVQSYYIFPFKILKPDLEKLHKELPNLSKEEVYLSYLNLVKLYTLVPQGNSKIYELIFKVSEKCSFISNDSCVSDYKNNIFSNFNHENANLTNIINKITNNTNVKEQCTDIQVGLALPGYAGKEKCIYMTREIKSKDDQASSQSYSFQFYDDKTKNEKKFDGELLIGTEPHGVIDSTYNKSDYFLSYNHINDYYFPPEGEDIDYSWDGKYINFSFAFSKIYYYDNNNVSPDNIKYIGTTYSNEGSLDYEMGLIKCPFGQYILIKQYIFEKYLSDNSCRETAVWGGFYGIICDKRKFNSKELYEKFNTLYFYNINLNYTFTLTSNDVFTEKDDFIYFNIISRNEILSIWRFGQIFLKKYYLTFDIEKKSIGFYITDREREKESGTVVPNNSDKKDSFSVGYVMLIMGIALLIVEIIAAALCCKKCNCMNRKKRANELLDDNYDYTSNVNIEEDKIIN